MPETAEDAANANPASPDATSSSVFSPSPPSFWDRSTWDPDSLGAIVFGQPVAPYRSPGQVLADAHDAVLTGPTHPGWSEPITRTTIDDIMSYMPSGPQPDGLLTPGLRLLAASGHPDPDLQAWAANDAARRAGVHPLQALWDLNAMSVTPEQTEAADTPADPSVSDTDDDDNADDPAQNATPSRDPASGGQASGSSLGGGSPSPPSEQGITLTQHGGQVADGNDPSPIDEVVVTGKRQAPRSGWSEGSQRPPALH